MRTIELPDAETQLPALVAGVESGEDVVITRNGKPVVRMSAAGPAKIVVTPEQQARAMEAIEDLARLREEMKLGPFNLEEFKADRDWGRE